MAGIKGAETVQIGIGQIIGIASAAMQLFGLFKAARDQFKRENPDAELPAELTDEGLIAALNGDSAALVATAKRLQAKYADPPATDSTTA